MITKEAPPARPPTGPKRPGRRRARWIFVLAAVAVLGLVAGLLVWAPWHQVPVAPAAVQAQSPTATSVLVSWAPSRGGATIDRYLVLRDGAQVGSVAAGRTSYVDNGLAPGTTHRYTIIAASGTERSHPSVSAVVRTITPSPVGLAAGPATTTTETFHVTLHWSPPPNGPVPDRYLIIGDYGPVVTLPGTTTSYTATGLLPGTTYTYQVAAMWGSQQSDRSSNLVVSTPTPADWANDQNADQPFINEYQGVRPGHGDPRAAPYAGTAHPLIFTADDPGFDFGFNVTYALSQDWPVSPELKPAFVGDVQLAVLASDTTTGSSCGTYRSDSGQTGTLYADIESVKLTVVVAATGRVLDTRTFTTTAGCPNTMTIPAGEAPPWHNPTANDPGQYGQENDVTAWINGFVTGPPRSAG
jgi:hypothetical protein